MQARCQNCSEELGHKGRIMSLAAVVSKWSGLCGLQATIQHCGTFLYQMEARNARVDAYSVAGKQQK